MSDTEERNETYLGDGLYASFDGYQILLRAPRLEGDHFVALEPHVFRELVALAEQYWPSSWRKHTKELEDTP